MKYVPRQIRNVESLFINRPLIAINMGIEIFCLNGSFIRILRSFVRVYRTVIYVFTYSLLDICVPFYIFSLLVDTIICIKREKERE